MICNGYSAARAPSVIAAAVGCGAEQLHGRQFGALGGVRPSCPPKGPIAVALRCAMGNWEALGLSASTNVESAYPTIRCGDELRSSDACGPPLWRKLCQMRRTFRLAAAFGSRAALCRGLDGRYAACTPTPRQAVV